MAININVKSSGGTKYNLEIPTLDETIGAFKVRLAEVSDIPAASQRLIFRGHVLKDVQTFQQIRDKHGLESGQTMHVVKGAPPRSDGGGGGGAGNATRSTTAGTQTAPTPGTPAGTGATGAGTTPGAGPGAVPGGMGGLPGLGGMAGMGGMGGMGSMLQNPEQMRAVLDSPFMASIMNNPEIARNMMMANPQLRAVIERNPEVGHVFNDPATFRQMMELARNPSLMQEMMRNTDRQMANLEMMPGGFDALRRMQQDIQAPLMDAVQNMGTDSNANAGTNAGNGENPFATLFQNTPSNAPMPNPWAPNNGTTPPANGGGAPPPSAATGAGTATAPPGTGAGAGAMPDMASLFGALGGGGAGGAGAMPNLPPEQMTAMMDNPMMRQLMESMASDPTVLDAMINANPQLRAMADANPQMAQMLRNPEIMRTMLSPEVMRSMMQLRSAMGGAAPGAGLGAAFGAGTTPSAGGTATATAPPAGTGTTPPAAGTGAGAGANTPDIAGLMAMMNAMGMGGGAAAPTPQPTLSNEQLEEMYASQLQQLRDMGFLDTPMCIQALRRANGNVAAAVEILLNQLGG